MLEWLKNGAVLQYEKNSVRVGIEETFAKQDPHWYFPDFFLEDPNPFISFKAESIIHIDQLKLNQASSSSLEWQEPDWRKFASQFNKFKKSSLEKAVVYVTYSAKHRMSISKLSSWLNCAFKYQKRFPSLSIYGYWNQKNGLLGLTPELFCRISKGRLQTMALAATVPVEYKERLLHDKKLQREQKIVIEGISERWGDKVFCSLPEILEIGPLAHLVSRIDLGYEKIDIALKKLHPTPALGAWPYLKLGEEWLKEYAELFPRKRYGAPCGYIQSNQEAVLHVAIRGIEWEENEIFLTVGCGLLKESHLEQEKKELQLKFETIKDIFQL